MLTDDLEKFPKPKDAGDEDGATALPQTLVRIPIHQVEAAQKDAEVSETAGE